MQPFHFTRQGVGLVQITTSNLHSLAREEYRPCFLKSLKAVGMLWPRSQTLQGASALATTLLPEHPVPGASRSTIAQSKFSDSCADRSSWVCSVRSSDELRIRRSDCARKCAHEGPKRPHKSQREPKFACRQLCGSAENMGKVGVMYERLAVRRSRVRIPSAPPFDARGKLSDESFPRFVYPERSRGAHGRPPAASNGASGTNNPGFSGLFYCQAIGPFDQSLPLDTLQPARHTEALSTGVHDGTGIGRAALSPPTAQPTAHHKPRRPLARSAAPEGVLLFQRRIPV